MFKKSFAVALLLAVTQHAYAQPTVHDNVYFPGGDSSFADAVVSFDPVIIDGRPDPKTQNPNNATGAPDLNSACFSSNIECNFATLGDGGSITLEFVDNYLTGSGTPADDLWIFEVGVDIEDAFIEISADGSEWISVGSIGGSTSGIDIDFYGFGPNDTFSFVRITDDTNEGDQDDGSNIWVGSDIDAVGAITSTLRSVCALDIETSYEVIPGTDECESIASLTFEYTGGGCAASNNIQQSSGDSECDTSTYAPLDDTAMAHVKAYSALPIPVEIPNGYIETPKKINPGESAVISLPSGSVRFEEYSILKLFNGPGTSPVNPNREFNRIKTQCVSDLRVGDVYGSATLTEIVGTGEPGTGTGGTTEDSYVYTYTVINNGEDVTDVDVECDEFGLIGSTPLLASGETATFTFASSIFTDSNIASVTADLEGTDDCTDTTEVQDFDLDGVPDDIDNCAIDFNPDQIDTNLNGVGDVCEPIVPSPTPDPPVGGCVYNANPGNSGLDVLFMILLACGIFYGTAALTRRPQ